MKGMHGIPAKI